MFIYKLLLFSLSPIIVGHIVWLTIKNKQWRFLKQRLGFNYSHLPKNSLWFHCASVGEVKTLLPLLKNIHKKKPQLPFIVSTNTDTAAQIVKLQNLTYLHHCYLPFDWALSVQRFITQTKPKKLYVMETEIWPNLFSRCKKNNISLFIINARLSKKSTHASPWIRALLSESLSYCSKIFTRSKLESEKFLSLVKQKNKVETFANLKLTTMNYSKKISVKKGVDNFSINRGFILLASSHEDEEQQIYSLWKNLNRSELLVIAPRHPKRRDVIVKQLLAEQLMEKKLSVKSKGQGITSSTQVFLLDTIGELNDYFAQAKLVIMGGSFVNIGGHNILEPASYHRAIITGPQMENFQQELEMMLEKNAIIQVQSMLALESSLGTILDDEKTLANLQNNTARLANTSQEILEKYTGIILKS